MTGQYETIVVDTQENVGFITFNRPEKRNAMNPRLHEEMNLALAALIEDDEIRVIILTGAGDSFCAGNDLKEFFAEQMDRPIEFRRSSRRFTEWRERLRTCPKPTIAAINGWCLGAGLSVICVADFAIAAEEAMFGLPEVNFGVFPAGGATKVLMPGMFPAGMNAMCNSGSYPPPGQFVAVPTVMAPSMPVS